MIRRYGCPLLIAVALALVGCSSADHPALNSYEGGYQVDSSGRLVVWLGAECTSVRSLTYELLDADGSAYDTWRVTSKSPNGAPLTTVTVGLVPAGFREADPLDSGWRDADSQSIRLRTPTDQMLAHLDVSDFLAEAEERGPADWYVPDQGWHTQAEYQAELVGSDKADIYPLCQVHD